MARRACRLRRVAAAVAGGGAVTILLLIRSGRRTGAPAHHALTREQVHSGDLPFIDRHCVHVAADPDATWQAMDAYFTARAAWMSRGVGNALVRWWGRSQPDARAAAYDPSPRFAGFAVRRASVPNELVLAGEHRFAAYTMTLLLAAASDGGTWLVMDTHARFRAGWGTAYRRLVIDTGAHQFAVRLMLERIKRRAETFANTAAAS